MTTVSGLFELAGLLLVAFLTPSINFFIPVRPTILTVLLARQMPWLAVGLVASIGGVLGVLPLYGIAYKATETRTIQRWLRIRSLRWLLEKLKRRFFLLVILLVVTPLPDQLIGIAGGAEKYPFGRFVLANLIGRSLVYLPLAWYAAHHAAQVESLWNWVLQLFTI